MYLAHLTGLLSAHRILLVLTIIFVSLASLLIWSMRPSRDSTQVVAPTAVVLSETPIPTPTFNQKREAVIKHYRTTGTYRRAVKNTLLSDEFRKIPFVPTEQRMAQANKVINQVNQYLIQLISTPLPPEEPVLALSRSHAIRWATEIQALLLKLSDAVRMNNNDAVLSTVSQLSNYQCDNDMIARNEIAEGVLAAYNISDSEADYGGRAELAQCLKAQQTP